MSHTFAKGSPELHELLRWWSALDHDRATRAELRRAQGTMDVIQLPSFHDVRRRLISVGLPEPEANSDRLALVAGLLSHIKANGESSAPKAFSQGDRPAVSPIRFRQVLEAHDTDELYRRLRRVLPSADGALSVGQLASDVFHWSESVRKCWVYDYAWPQKQSI